jgi:hypothetical protein
VDPDVAAAMARHVGDLDPKTVRQVAKQARGGDTAVPAEERVQAARAAVLIGHHVPHRTDTYPLRSGDGDVHEITREVVVLSNTALRTIRPRTTEMDRDAFAAMVTQICEDTGVWPIPSMARLAPEVCRSMIDDLCRAADYYPERPLAEANVGG